MTVPRSTPSGAAFNDLRNLARRTGRSPQELYTFHALDGFLARLAASPQREHVVLKGGALLAAFDLRRPTRDIDLQAHDLANDAQTVLALVRSVATLPGDDGLVFDAAAASASIIRDDDEYAGVRVSLVAHLATVEIHLHIDVNVGDPIVPEPQVIELPRVLGEPVVLRGYPIVMVHAEKIITAVSRGTANTRWRDFGDVYSLAGRHDVAGDDFALAISSVAAHRKVHLLPLAEVLAGFPALAQARYDAWRRRHDRDDLPNAFQEVLDRVIGFADPALLGSVTEHRWDAHTTTWV